MKINIINNIANIIPTPSPTNLQMRTPKTNRSKPTNAPIATSATSPDERDTRAVDDGVDGNDGDDDVVVQDDDDDDNGDKKKNDNNGSANNEHNDSEHDNCISAKETTTNETLTSNNSTPNVKQNKIAVSQYLIHHYFS
jgi:hypothetical protein